MKTPKKLLEENINKSKKEFLKYVQLRMKKCTVCGKYGLNKEINECKIIKGKIYSCICRNCSDLLSNNNKFTRNINYEVEFIEDLVHEYSYKNDETIKNDSDCVEIKF